jgi:hypothetical protein
MTAKQKSNVVKALWTLGGGLAAALLIGIFTYAGNGVVAGNQSKERIAALRKDIDEHISVHGQLEKAINDRFAAIEQKKADKEVMDRIDERMGRIEMILMSNNKLLKADYVNFRSIRSGNGGGMRYDTVN